MVLSLSPFLQKIQSVDGKLQFKYSLVINSCAVVFVVVAGLCFVLKYVPNENTLSVPDRRFDLGLVLFDCCLNTE